MEHRGYQHVTEYLSPGDVVVLNDTKVIKARLIATNNAGQPRELLLLEDHHNTDFTRRKALYRGKIRPGEQLTVARTPIKIESILGSGIAEVSSSVNLLDLANRAGTVPLPPYMHRDATSDDIARYQTVFAQNPGSIAAPTASLNFTQSLQKKLEDKGVIVAYLTLHVGLGTFLPIRSDKVEKHQMHSEYFQIPKKTVQLIQKAHPSDNKIVGVGTTVARTLEFVADDILNHPASDLSGEADIFIYPGYTFKLVNSLLTNFHAPKSTVLMLTAAFAGWSNLNHAYQEAIKERYAFLSYGDSMLII